MKNAFVAANMKHRQGNILLKALREYPFNLHLLPKDSRTLLKTPTVVVSRIIQQVSGGKYHHVGFKSNLLKKLKSPPANYTLPNILEIELSTDGGKIDKGLDQFWPHQFRVFNIPDKKPMIAGIFKGRHKLSNPFDFYEQLIQEISELRDKGGIVVRNQRIPLFLDVLSPMHLLELSPWIILAIIQPARVWNVKLTVIDALYKAFRAQWFFLASDTLQEQMRSIEMSFMTNIRKAEAHCLNYWDWLLVYHSK